MRIRFSIVLVLAGAVALVAAPSATIPNHIGELRALRAQYPATITQAQAGEMMNRLAWQLRGEGFGLLRKDGGNNCPIPGSSVRVSCDWIVHAPTGQGCDVLGSGPDADAPGPSTPNWCDGDAVDMSRFFPPVDPGTPAPGPTPPTPPPAATGITQAQLDAALAALHDRILADVAASLPPAAPGVSPADLKSTIDDAFNRAYVDGKTSAAWGHQHTVHLTVSRR